MKRWTTEGDDRSVVSVIHAQRRVLTSEANAAPSSILSELTELMRAEAHKLTRAEVRCTPDDPGSIRTGDEERQRERRLVS